MPISVSSTKTSVNFHLLTTPIFPFHTDLLPLPCTILFCHSSLVSFSCFNLFLKRSRVTFLLLLEFSSFAIQFHFCVSLKSLLTTYCSVSFLLLFLLPREILFGKSASCLSLTLNSHRADWIVSTTNE